jgi:hypothetical protein
MSMSARKPSLVPPWLGLLDPRGGQPLRPDYGPERV